MAAIKDAEELRKEVEIGHKSSLRTNGLHGFDIISTLSFCLQASFVFTIFLQDDWNVGGVEELDGIGSHLTTNLQTWQTSLENHSSNALQPSEPHPLILHREVHSEA